MLREHALWVDAPLSRFVLAAALAQHRRRIDTDRVILLEHIQQHRVYLRLARDCESQVVARPAARLDAGRQQQHGRIVRSPAIGRRPCSHPHCQVERLDTLLLEVAQRLALERDERTSYLLARLGFGPRAYDGVGALRIPASA